MGLFKILFAPILFILKLLTSKVKKAKPEAVTDLESPTADAGRPIPVVFGTINVKGINCLWAGEKTHKTHKVKA